VVTCKKCGRERKHHAHGMCLSCYHSERTPPERRCVECGEIKPIKAKGKCTSCYRKQYYQAKEAGHRKQVEPTDISDKLWSIISSGPVSKTQLRKALSIGVGELESALASLESHGRLTYQEGTVLHMFDGPQNLDYERIMR